MNRLVDEMLREAKRQRGLESGYRMAGERAAMDKARRIAVLLETVSKEMTA